MNQDLKPFYETAHKIYQELLSGDNIQFQSVFNPSLLHENQFQSLIDILVKLGFIINRLDIESMTVSGFDRGNSFTEYQKWLPEDTSTLYPSRNEYYLLYLEYYKRSVGSLTFPHKTKSNSDKIYLLSQVISNKEIFSISLGINKGGKGFINIRNQSFPLIAPNQLLIYDLTKLDGYSTKHTREGFQDLFNKATANFSEIDVNILEKTGENVTSQLGYNLADLKLPYFETYYRLTHFFPDFETLLLDELNLLTTSKRKHSIKSSAKRIKAKVNSNSESIGMLNGGEPEADKHLTLFKYGIYFPTIKDNQIEPCFKVKTVASVFANHISRLQEETGQMVGIFGKWGRGKTYLKKEVEEIFENEKSKYNFTVIDFHAWKYQDTPAIWAYLYERLSEKYFGSGWFCKFWRKLKLNILREKSNIITDILFLGLLWSLFTGILSLLTFGDSNIIQDYWWQTISTGTLASALLKFWKKEGTNARELLKKYSKGISFNQYLGIQAEIEKELVILLETWIADDSKERLVLFVDDIDRCSEKKIIEIVDSLRVMLEHPAIVKRVIVLVAIDEEKLEMAIRYKYREFYPPTSDNHKILEDLTREYMDKLFISGIKLQALNNDNINEFISTLVEQDWRDMPQNRIPSLEKKSEEQEFSEISNLPSTNLNNEEPLHENMKSSSNMIEDNINETYLEELDSSDVKKMFRKEFVELKEELTPRQIRILYYRFQLAKNLYIKLLEAENDQLITDGLKGLLKAIHLKTVSKKDHYVEDPVIDQIAEMVVGY